MSIRIERDLCNGCGQCRAVCPGNLLYADEGGRTIIRNPRDCWGCASCIKECSQGAIRYFLGADIGGLGSCFYTRREGVLLHWTMVRPDSGEVRITLDRRQANAY